MPHENWRQYPSGSSERFRVQEKNLHRQPFEKEWPGVGDLHTTQHAATVAAKTRALATGTPCRVVRADPMGQEYGVVVHSHQVLEYNDMRVLE